MASLLFPPCDLKMGAQKRLAYVTILSDIARGCSDSIDALCLFDDLLHGKVTEPESLGFMAFDAHVGDTGCQLRAGMIQDLFDTQRRLWANNPIGSGTTPPWLSSTVQKLRSTLDNARVACAELTKRKVQPVKLGFGAKHDTPTNILSAIGWQEDTQTDRYPDQDYASIDKRLGELRSLLKQCSVDAESIQPEGLMLERSDSGSSERSDSSVDFELSPRSIGSSRMSSITADDESGWGLKTRWSATNPHSIIRFLVYAFILSKYKAFCRLGKAIGARLNEHRAAEYGTGLVAEWVNSSNVEYKPAKIQRVVSEFRAMQEWLSDYSCAWVRSLSQRSSAPLDLYSLVRQTVQRSAKGLIATACFPAYLLQREQWARVGRPLILIDRHFCPSGWHYNIFEAQLSTPSIDKCACAHKGGMSVQWKLRQTSIQELITSKENVEPHLTVMGNSTAGCYDKYMDRIPSHDGDEIEGSQVHDAECSENEAHICDFVQTDHDDVALSFFADHELYAFPLSSGVDEVQFFDSCIETFEDEFWTVQEGFRKSREDAGTLGSGRDSIHILGWQHMFIDTRPRLGARLNAWKEMANLMPLSAGCT